MKFGQKEKEGGLIGAQFRDVLKWKGANAVQKYKWETEQRKEEMPSVFAFQTPLAVNT